MSYHNFSRISGQNLVYLMLGLRQNYKTRVPCFKNCVVWRRNENWFLVNSTFFRESIRLEYQKRRAITWVHQHQAAATESRDPIQAAKYPKEAAKFSWQAATHHWQAAMYHWQAATYPRLAAKIHRQAAMYHRLVAKFPKQAAMYRRQAANVPRRTVQPGR